MQPAVQHGDVLVDGTMLASFAGSTMSVTRVVWFSDMHPDSDIDILVELLGPGEDARKLSDEILAGIMPIMKRQQRWETFFQPAMLRVYADNFAENDIGAIIAFYRSPSGKALLAKLPLLMPKGGELGQQRMQEVVPELNRIVTEKIDKYKREHPRP